MKLFELKMRLIAPLVVMCCLISVGSQVAQAQIPRTPTSGAVVAINGTVGSNPGTPLNILIYDSQIHSSFVGQVPLVPCTSADAVVLTDAYVLQGGSPTGCDPSVYDITDVATSVAAFVPRTDNSTHQLPGATDITKSAGLGSPLLPGTGFHIETHFICVGKCANGVTGSKTFCNTSGTICINVLRGNPADNGFIVVKNNTGSDFTGSIKLQGSSTGCGAANDTSTNLASGASVTLAMGTPGTVAAPNTLDSATCGGFNFDQVGPTMTSSTQSTTFIFGADKFTVTPADITVGDILTFRPVPVPASLFNLPGSTLTNSTFGNGQQCVSISDFAAPTGANIANPVCPEFQTKCFRNSALTIPCSDAGTFFWKGEFNAHLDPNAGYPLVGGVPEIGAVHFLGQPGATCPQKTFSEDIALSYTGDTPDDLPLTSGGKGFNCFVTAYDPTQPAVGPGVQVFAFNGFFPPVQPPPTINPINGGQNVPLPFFYANGAGGPAVTNLNWCPDGPKLPPNANLCATGVPEPWVAFLRTHLPACSFPPIPVYIGASPTNSFMQNLGSGNYKFNWATSNTEPTTNNCFSIGVVFNNGTANPDVDRFAFIK